MALTPLKVGRDEGALRRGNQGGCVTAFTRHFRGTALGGGDVGGSQIQQWHSRAQSMREEGDDRWCPPVS
jgi:hypothetical protein